MRDVGKGRLAWRVKSNGGAPLSKLRGIHLKINSGFYEVGKSEIFVISVPSYFFLILWVFLVVFASFVFSLHPEFPMS